ncbi:MAG: hypothetical protein ACRYFX_03580 [Janthinobacterium lividum]
MTTILTDNFETKLGTVQTWIETDYNASFLSQSEGKMLSEGHEIIFQSFELTEISLPKGMEYETSKVWRYFVRKTGPKKEKLLIFCKLINPTNDTEYGTSSGQCIDAIEIETQTHHLHIGTEDSELMQYRAEKSDWMPKRFENDLGSGSSFTEYSDFGFKTTIPDLEDGEKIYFHFIVATNPIKPSQEYPDERNISTWFAVDQSKKSLDNQLKNKFLSNP